MSDNVETPVDLKGRAASIVQKIIAACDKAEHSGTAHYIKTGALCRQFVDVYCADDGKRRDAVDILKGKLADAGLRNLDVSAYCKSSALHSICPTVETLPVSCLIALLPLCNSKGDSPQWVDGVSSAAVAKYVEKIGTEHIPATKVRAYVQSWLGNDDKTESKAWEKTVAYLNKCDDRTLTAALRNNETLRDRLIAILEKATPRFEDTAKSEAA